MTDDVWRRREIASPCIKICLVHPQAKICTGCYRTPDEIAVWSKLSDQDRAEIMEDLPIRAGTLSVRRGGRRARLQKDKDGA